MEGTEEAEEEEEGGGNNGAPKRVLRPMRQQGWFPLKEGGSNGWTEPEPDDASSLFPYSCLIGGWWKWWWGRDEVVKAGSRGGKEELSTINKARFGRNQGEKRDLLEKLAVEIRNKLKAYCRMTGRKRMKSNTGIQRTVFSFSSFF